MTEPTKYIITKRFGAIELVRDDRGLWRDAFGTVFAIMDQEDVLDPVMRCGIYPIVIPINIPELEAGCIPHDYMHTSTAYQLYHTMEEANLEMLRLHDISTKGHWSRLFIKPFYWITDVAKPFFNWSGKK